MMLSTKCIASACCRNWTGSENSPIPSLPANVERLRYPFHLGAYNKLGCVNTTLTIHCSWDDPSAFLVPVLLILVHLVLAFLANHVILVVLLLLFVFIRLLVLVLFFLILVLLLVVVLDLVFLVLYVLVLVFLTLLVRDQIRHLISLRFMHCTRLTRNDIWSLWC